MDEIKVGDIVTNAPGWTTGVFLITDGKNGDYIAKRLPDMRPFRLKSAGIGPVVGRATEEFLNGGSKQAEIDRDRKEFVKGRSAAEFNARFSMDAVTKARWGKVAVTNAGDLIEVRTSRTGATEKLEFVRAMATGKTFAFIAKRNGKNLKFSINGVAV